MKKDIRDIADERGLSYITTTADGNGYPKNLKYVIVGFETFEKAQELAEEYNLEIERFEKKEGWSLWWRTGNWAGAPFEIKADLFGDDYVQYFAGTEDEFVQNEVKDVIAYLERFDEIEARVEKARFYLDEIENLDEEEVLIIKNFESSVVYKQKQMYYSYDSRAYIIGLIEK